MPERGSFNRHALEEKIAKGRAFTMQIEPSLWTYCQQAAVSETSCRAEIIAIEGETHPARIRWPGKVLRTVNGLLKGPPKFYAWQIATNTVCKVKVPFKAELEDRIAVSIEHPGGEPGFMKFWKKFDELVKKQALKTSAKVVKTPASK